MPISRRNAGALAGATLFLAALSWAYMSLAEAASPANPDAVAVIIGNRTYKHPRVPAVEYAHRDAEAMKRFVIDGLGYREGNIIDLRDATEAQLRSAFGSERDHRGKIWQYLKAGRSDVLVFFSGHGVPGMQDRRGFLLPVDADPDTVEVNGYPIDQLYANLAKLEARSVTVYLDACFSGDSPKGMLVRSASPVFVKTELPKSVGKLTVLTAASGEELASWDEQAKHGLFTEYLLRGLYGEADGMGGGARDGKVSVAELKTWLDEEMSYRAKREYRRVQTAGVTGDTGVLLVSWPGGKPPARPKLGQDVPTQQASLPPPAASPVVETLDTTYVALRTANLRAEPNATSKQTGRLDADESVAVTGRATIGREIWYLVGQGSGSAWVLGTLVKEIDAAEAEAWRKVKDAKGAGPVETFLKDHPRGHFAERAQQLAAVLRVPPPQAGAPVQPAAGVYPPARAAPALPLSSLPAPGTGFKDCDVCPEMVVVPAGSFTMGSPEEERRWAVSMGSKEEWIVSETPPHRVTIPRSFAAGKHEVTRGEYAAFVRETNRGWGDGCFIWAGTEWKKEASGNWRDPGFGQDDRHPVACVSWDDAKAYVEWLGRKAGKAYRLLSEAEWEYAARAGTTAARYWGDDRGNAESCGYANGTDQTRAAEHNLTRVKTNIFMCEDGHVHTAPVGSFKANAFGLHDMLGNVWEWVEDCWHESYGDAPKDGSAWTAGGSCGQRVLRGGSWVNNPWVLRAANRDWVTSGNRDADAGFRVARTQ